MAGHAKGAEGFSGLRIAFRGQGGEFGKFGVESLRGFFSEQRRCVDGFGDSGTFAEFFARLEIGLMGLIRRIGPIKAATNLSCTPSHFPHAEFGHHALGALGGAAPADLAVFPFGGRGLGAFGVEFAVLVDAEDAFVVASDGKVGPKIGCHGLVGHADIAKLGTGIDAEFAAEEIHVHAALHAEEAVFVTDAGC